MKFLSWFIHSEMKLKKQTPNINLTFWNQYEFTKYAKQRIKRSGHHANAHEISKAPCKKAWEILYGEDVPDYSDSEGTTSHETLPFQFGDQEIASETKTFLKKHILEVSPALTKCSPDCNDNLTRGTEEATHTAYGTRVLYRLQHKRCI